LRETGGEIESVDTVYLALSDIVVLSVGLICGADMQTVGEQLFQQILSTIVVQ